VEREAFRTYLTYAQMVSIQKNALRTSFRSGDPRHRFDVERMKSEQGRHESTAPWCPRHSVEDVKQQQGIENMERIR